MSPARRRGSGESSLSKLNCAWLPSSTAVLPERNPGRGPPTEAAGFTGTTWPLTGQSNRCRRLASCCLTVGAETWRH